jgi:TRAP transporter TAXI family solute receptor
MVPRCPCPGDHDVRGWQACHASPDAVGSRAWSPFPLLRFAAISLLAISCESPGVSPRHERVVLRFTTGPPGASFSPFGDALAEAFERTSLDVSVRARPSGGSLANVEALQRGEADMGLAFADVAYQAFTGRLDTMLNRFDRLRAIAVLQLTPVQLVARADTSIRSVADLRGRRVAVGPPESGTALTARLILQAFDVRPSDVHVETIPFSDAGVMLARGTLDAMFDIAIQRTESGEQALRAGARLIPITGVRVDRLRRDYPFLRLTVVPRGRYPGVPAVPTIGVDNLLLCRRDLDEALVHEITRRLFEVLPSLSLSRGLDFVDLDQAPATPIPLHEGAARHYRQQELLR